MRQAGRVSQWPVRIAQLRCPTSKQASTLVALFDAMQLLLHPFQPLQMVHMREIEAHEAVQEVQLHTFRLDMLSDIDRFMTQSSIAPISIRAPLLSLTGWMQLMRHACIEQLLQKRRAHFGEAFSNFFRSTITNHVQLLTYGPQPQQLINPIRKPVRLLSSGSSQCQRHMHHQVKAIRWAVCLTFLLLAPLLLHCSCLDSSQQSTNCSCDTSIDGLDS